MVLELHITKSKEDILQCQANNFVTWGEPLTLKQYQHRDAINYESSYMNLNRDDYFKDINGGIYFILKDSKTNIIESACEILIRDSWIANNGKLIDCKSAVIGSVYTVEKFRGKGNASLMINELNLKMKQFLKNEFDTAFLYSEVGEYYSKFGYKSFNKPVIEIDLSINNQFNLNNNFKYNPLFMDFNEISSDYFNRMKELVINQSILKKGNHFMLKPNIKIFEWFANRARVNYWAINHPLVPAPYGIEQERSNNNNNNKVNEILNIITGFTIKDEQNRLNYIIFYPQFHSNDCYILLMHSDRKENAIKLIKLVINQCKKWGMKKIYGWETDIGDYNNIGDQENTNSFLSFLKDNGINYHIKETNSSLSAIQFLNKDSNNDNNKIPTYWDGNGKWCWF